MSSGPRVYVAGPIARGDQFQNVRNAVLAAERLRRAGCVPFVPHLFATWHQITPVPYEEIMAWDFAWLEQCSALIRLPGESSGADREVAYALRHGLMIFALGTMDVVDAAIKEMRDCGMLPEPCAVSSTCAHVFDGPPVESDDGRTQSVTCSKCGLAEMAYDMVYGP